jgi:hypothetical protein
LHRRSVLKLLAAAAAGGALRPALAQQMDPEIEDAVNRALDYLVREQRRQGYWEANGGQYRIAMTALAGLALLCEGSTTTEGRFAQNISRCVDYLLDQALPSGLIGYQNDYHYTYGHGFSMLLLSQVLGEDGDLQRRRRLQHVLAKAVEFSALAQTSRGGWGYVSAREMNDFDEGSTCITQVQGLRACRNAGIVVPREIIDRAKQYIYDCMAPDGGVQYSIRGGGSRPPITAAAVAAMYNAGEYDDEPEVQRMLDYCSANIWPGGGISQSQHFGHWHYAHFYFAQVMYRQEEQWADYFAEISTELLRSQLRDGSWNDGQVGPIYVTAINSMILQFDRGYVPIFQR